jgi:hypothetical protein
MWFWFFAFIACTGQVSGDTREAEDTGSSPEWAPIFWEGCTALLDAGNLPGLDDRMVFRPGVVGDQVWFGMAANEGFQSIGWASLDGPQSLVGIDAYLQGHEIGTRDVSSPAPVQRPDGGIALFFDAWQDGAGLGIWRCDLTEEGGPGDCELVVPQGSHGGLDGAGAQIPFVHVASDGTWRLWYTGLDGGGVRRILASTSADGWDWETPVMAVDIGSAGVWDESSAYSPFAWQDETGWRMLYAGRAEYKSHQVKRLIEARSDDAIVWEGHTMTLDLGCAGEWDAWRVDSPWVVAEDGGWHLYYDGFDDPITDVGTRRLLTATGPI